MEIRKETNKRGNGFIKSRTLSGNSTKSENRLLRILRLSDSLYPVRSSIGEEHDACVRLSDIA